MKIIKIHGVEDQLFDQIEKCDGIGCFVENFIKRVHQFEMLDENRTGKMRDKKKYFVHHSINEWMSINGDVKNQNIEAKHNTRRKRKVTTNIFVT